MYTTQQYESSISVSDYLEEYVDISGFREACKKCGNYGRVWACPPYDFDVEQYWKKYATLQLLAVKIVFEPSYTEKTYTPEELHSLTAPILHREKQKISDILFHREQENAGSVSLSAGSCSRCPQGCLRTEGKPCRFPDTMRYSIESLGGNVGLTLSRLMRLHLEWMEEGRLPHHFVLVGGLLLPEPCGLKEDREEKGRLL